MEKDLKAQEQILARVLLVGERELAPFMICAKQHSCVCCDNLININ